MAAKAFPPAAVSSSNGKRRRSSVRPTSRRASRNIVIHDYCSDAHGVKAYAWITRNGRLSNLGGDYNGNSVDGAAVTWDPFPGGNVAPGDKIGLKVCLVDGNNDATAFNCQEANHISADG